MTRAERRRERQRVERAFAVARKRLVYVAGHLHFWFEEMEPETRVLHPETPFVTEWTARGAEDPWGFRVEYEPAETCDLTRTELVALAGHDVIHATYWRLVEILTPNMSERQREAARKEEHALVYGYQRVIFGDVGA